MNSEIRTVRYIREIPVPELVVLPTVSATALAVRERINLQEVLGQQMQTTFIQVLKQVGADLGWVRDTVNQDLYIKDLGSGVEMWIDIHEEPPIIVLRATRTGEAVQAPRTQQELAALLKEVEPVFHLELNTLLDHCYVQGLKDAAPNFGTVTHMEEHVNRVTHSHALQIHISSN